MNQSYLYKSHLWLLNSWNKVSLEWRQRSENGWLIRAAWVTASLLSAVIVTSLFLAILPVVLVSAILMTIILKLNRVKQNAPVTINVTPERN